MHNLNFEFLKGGSNLDLNAILNRFTLLSNIPLDEIGPFVPICSDAKTEIQLKIRPNVDESAEGERLEAAAAALSFYKYTLYNASLQSTQSFSAGDVSIKEDTKQQIENARLMWNETRASIRDLLQDDEFCFQQVITYV